MTERSVRVFAPASVSNVACGFDALGFALEHRGDVIRATATDDGRVEIAEITGDGGRLPRETERNTAGLAAMAARTRWLERQPSLAETGVRLKIDKRMPLSSGLGSSAASAVAGAVATDRLFADLNGDTGLDRGALLLCALEGERLASGAEHADNLAPSLFGGFVLVRALRPDPDIVELPVPAGLHCALVRPDIPVQTNQARGLIGELVPLHDAIAHWANTGALVAALYSNDLGLLARALEDRIAEPRRAHLVPGFDEAKSAALEAGALGASLSGSGPTLFALTADRPTAERVGSAMAHEIERAHGSPPDCWVSAVGVAGARVLEETSESSDPRELVSTKRP